jgi:hypothetical protein
VDVDGEIAHLRVIDGAFCLALRGTLTGSSLVAALDPIYHWFGLPDKNTLHGGS